MNNNWNYIGVFLDDGSKEKLLNIFGKHIPEGWKPFCHHMTLAYNNGQQEPQMMYDNYYPRFGESVTLNITAIGISDKAIAARVSWNDDIINKIPHVTIATSPTGKPVDSNYITEWATLPYVITLTGKIGVFNKKNFKK